MAPYFETVVKSFADIPVTDDGAPTAEFLEASDGLVGMFGSIGLEYSLSSRLTLKDVRTVFTSEPQEYHTLERLVQNEQRSRRKHRKGCLRRLLCGRLFALLFSGCAGKVTRREASTVRIAVLRHHHGFAIRAVSQVASHACPNRRDFYLKMAQSGSQEKLDEELYRWLIDHDVRPEYLSALLCFTLGRSRDINTKNIGLLPRSSQTSVRVEDFFG
ncbi:hypothetical protein ACEPAI_4367 [Sanghuangporus weigelae]